MINLKGKHVLGSGCSKVCYAIGGKKVVLVTDDNIIDSEVRKLRRLRKAGIPVLGVRVTKAITEEGEEARVLIAPRYDYHTFDFCGRKLNSTHVANLRKIFRGLKRHKIEVNDLQFLANRSGDVVVCDPGSLTIGRGKKMRNHYSLETIESILKKHA